MAPLVKSFFLSLLLSTACFAEQIAIQKFCGLNNNENSTIIDPCQASDLLNVEITPGGRSVKKRDGYGLYKDLGTSQGIHGGHHFFNSDGSDVQLWGSGTTFYAIISDAEPTVIVSSATSNATWDCADTQGSAYCVNSSRDLYLKTDGASLTSWGSSPLGTMVEATPDRIIVSGVSGTPSTIYFSESGVFTNFTTDIDEPDPFTEVIAAPGARVTHIRWGCGRVLWWKNASFGYLNGDNQFNIENVIVSDNIGTVDNSSSMDPGGSIWFRGQDGHIYKYDCSGLSKESIDITPNVQASGNRTANSWTQTSESDFEAGASSPSYAISTSISAGDVTVSSFTSSGTFGFFNPGFEVSADGDCNAFLEAPSSWTIVSGDVGCRQNGCVGGGGVSCSCSPTVVSAQTGSTFLNIVFPVLAVVPSPSVSIRLESDDSSIASQSLTFSSTKCDSWEQNTLTIDAEDLNQSVYVQITIDNSSSGGSVYTIKSDPFIGCGPVKYYWTSEQSTDLTPATYRHFYWDSFTGVICSDTQDSGLTINYSMVTTTMAVSDFALQHSTSTSGQWANLVFSSGTSAASNQYLRTISTTSVGQSIYLSTFIARSTGTYLSAVHNGPNLTAWDIFTADEDPNGGTFTYYIRSDTNSYTVQSDTPTWVAQTNGGLVSASTGTYFQARIDFGITSATQTPTISDFTFNWFEGTASDKAYSLYFDDAIWWSVAFGAGQATNNYIFRFDLINQIWTVFDFGAGGLIQQGNSLYFGQVSGDNLFKFGSGKSDNGTAIEAYWTSKDFPGPDPFLENIYKQVDTYAKTDQNQALTVDYFLDTETTSTSYSINLSSTTDSVIRNKKLLPNGKRGDLFKLKYGDDSDTSAWEILGVRFVFQPQPYRPGE